MPHNRLINLVADTGLSSPVSLVLEAGEEIWPTIQTRVGELMRSEPGLGNAVHFLGSNTKYSCTALDFPRDAPGWFSANANRVSLLGPIYCSVTGNHEFVVFCNRPPVDIDDWLNSDMLARTLFITPQPENFPSSTRTMPPEETDFLLTELKNPVQEVVLKGPGFAPLRWELEGSDDAGINVVFSNDMFRLLIPLVHGRMRLHVQGIAAGENPQLHICRLRGSVERRRLNSEKPWFPEPVWHPVPKHLFPVMKAMRAGSGYGCDQGDVRRKPAGLRHPADGRVLQGLPLDTWLLFSGKKYLPLTDLHGWPLADNTRLITKDGDLFETFDGTWRRNRRIENFAQVDEHVRALYNTL